MEIRLILDKDNGVDRIDPSGEILITNGKDVIFGEYVYLDSWLDALIEALRAAQAGKRATIDLVEEPDPLIVDPENGGLKLTYRNTTVLVDSIDEFRQALMSASVDFLRKLGVDEDRDTELLKSIRKFSKANLS